jgi:hypothetical protein
VASDLIPFRIRPQPSPILLKVSAAVPTEFASRCGGRYGTPILPLEGRKVADNLLGYEDAHVPNRGHHYPDSGHRDPSGYVNFIHHPIAITSALDLLTRHIVVATRKG